MISPLSSPPTNPLPSSTPTLGRIILNLISTNPIVFSYNTATLIGPVLRIIVRRTRRVRRRAPVARCRQRPWVAIRERLYYRRRERGGVFSRLLRLNRVPLSQAVAVGEDGDVVDTGGA